MEKTKVQALEQRLVQFSVSLIRVTELLPENKAARHIEGQLVRSGTAPALIYAEAQSAESKADFIHKMKVGLKELRETWVGLKMIEQMAWVAQTALAPTLKENDELISIFVVSIRTASNK